MDVNTRKEEINILDAAVKLVRFLLNNLIWVGLFPLVGILVGFMLTRNQPRFYNSQLAMRLTMVSEEEMTLLLTNYTRHAIPGLSDAEINEIGEFQFDVYTKDNSLFTVITSVASDTSLLKKIYTAVPKQLDQEDIINAYFEVNHNYNKKMLQQYKEKIQMAEALLQTKKEGQLREIPELLTLYARLEDIELQANKKSLIKVVSHFKPIEVSPSGNRSVLKGAVLGVLLGMAFLGIKSFVTYYRESGKETL